MIVIKFGKWERHPGFFYIYERIMTKKGKPTIFCRRKKRHMGRFWHPWKFIFIRNDLKRLSENVTTPFANQNYAERSAYCHGWANGIIATASVLFNIHVAYVPRIAKYKCNDKKGRNKKLKKMKKACG